MADDILGLLKAIVGEAYVLDAPAAMARYLQGNGRPQAVVLPGQTSEVSEIVKLANRLKLKVQVGGSLVDTLNLDDGIAVVLSHMNRLLEIDRENLVAVVEPGIGHEEFVRRVAAEGLNFPVDPYIAASSSLGGCFARGDADAKSFQYGPTRTYLLGFEMVLPTGEILDIGNKCIKNVAGYDYIHFAVGSMGALGIFTRLLVKLLPMPQARASVVATFPTLRRAAVPLETLVRRNIHPSRLSVLSQPLADAVFPGIGGQLVMVDFESFRESTKALVREVAAVFSLAGGSDVLIVEAAAEHAALWEKWLAVKGRLNCRYSAPTIDFAVGPLKLGQALAALEKTLALEELQGVNIEALLGNIRVALPAGIPAQEFEALAEKINGLAMNFGGSVAGCLGTRLVCRSYRDEEMWAAISGLLQTVRQEFDPEGVLAPGISFS